MKPLISFLVLFVITLTAYAQTGTIRGTIYGENSGEALIGANVLVVGTTKGASTDLDGFFSIDIAPGTYSLRITYTGFKDMTIEEVQVSAGEVTLFENLMLAEIGTDLDAVVVTASQVRNTESALMTIKKKAPAMLDGISSARFKITGDATAVEAAKRVTGVSIEGGKYMYVRGLGDRYSKTTLNGVDIPGLDPDRNTLQLDIFPTNLINNMMVSKNFTAEMPADFTGGLMNIETKDFPEERVLNFSIGTEYNPNVHFNADYLDYKGSQTDFLGFDDGTRALPRGADQPNIPTPISGHPPQEVNAFVNSFGKDLSALPTTSLMDLSASFSYGNQFSLGQSASGNNRKLGVIFSASYKSDYTYYSEVTNAEYQRLSDPSVYDLTYATIQKGQLGERSFLLGSMAGIAYKSSYFKLRLTAMHLQNGVSRAGQFDIQNNGQAVGQSGYIALSDNLEYNQRSLTNVMLHGTHVTKNSGWEVDWRLSPTLSISEDPDIRKTAFTLTDDGERYFFAPGAGGNPVRIWRDLSELNAMAKVDVTKSYSFNGAEAKFKFGASQIYKERDYEILLFDVQFLGRQPNWPEPDPALVLTEENIFPNGKIYMQSGNAFPNPNAYNSNVSNTGAYVSNEFSPFSRLKTILGVRAENYVQRHTGRDQAFASGNSEGKNLDNEKVLESLDFFPSVNLIYSLNERNNLRGSYTRTIARPSFKELSFAQILDPVTNRIFNGSLFEYSDWDGNLVETRINNFDLRWELFLSGGEMFSASAFYKQFDKPIELVRIPEAQTTTEFQPRNVGNGQLYGIELEFRKNLDFIAPGLEFFNISTNVTLVRSQIDMSETEFRARKNFEREGETIEDTREMAGQAPWVINAGLSYSNPEAGVDAGLFYNVKGQTLSVVGIGLYPDVYIQPFHSLNFSFIKRVGANRNTSIDFKVNNILNDRVESVFQSFQADDQFFSSINPGVGISLGLSHNF